MPPGADSFFRLFSDALEAVLALRVIKLASSPSASGVGVGVGVGVGLRDPAVVDMLPRRVLLLLARLCSPNTAEWRG